MWTSKPADERRQELLKAALEVFAEKGYQKTTINDILAKVGVTKGAFYYHFKSMDEVVESIALQEASRMIGLAQQVTGREELDGLGKIRLLISWVMQYTWANLESRQRFFRLMLDEKNAWLAQRINQEVYAQSFPLILGILQQGATEGSLRLASPEDAADLYIQLSLIFKSSITRLLDEGPDWAVIARRLRYFQHVLEAALGADPGALGDLAQGVDPK